MKAALRLPSVIRAVVPFWVRPQPAATARRELMIAEGDAWPPASGRTPLEKSKCV